MTLTRRALLRSSALTGAGLAIGTAFSGFAAGRVSAGSAGYGPLVPDPAGLLDLPHGFQYRVLGKGGNLWSTGFTSYDDGQKLAGDADGAASFAIGRNRTVLVTNHELSASELDERVPTMFDGSPVPTYDSASGGGTSNIVMDPAGNVISIYPSLAGTFNNCCGGRTPWGTWLTCEETESTVGGVPHGYIFEVDALGELTTAVPYKAMGRFAHEAVAIDPATSYAYMTEDNTTGLLYRFIPTDTSMTYGSLGNGGAVSAMCAFLNGTKLGRLGEVTSVGTVIDITWTPCPVDPDRTGLRNAFSNDRVTRSTKLEGTWWENGVLYFASSFETVAGVEHHGQIWAYDPVSSQATLVAYIPVDHPTFDSPDNITVTPWGDLILCEDGDGEQYLVGLDPSTGSLWAFARNADAGQNEFAGANFSPDGNTLFVSVQSPSTTFAITGPWGAVRPNS
jgi:uncharacterized protein